MAMLRRVVVLCVGLVLVAASGAIDAAVGPDEAADGGRARAEGGADGDARELTAKGASRLDAALVAALAAEAPAPTFELRRLRASERAAILGVAAAEQAAPLTVGVRERVAAAGHRLDLVSRAGHVDLRGEYAAFQGAAEVLRGPLRPAATLTLEAAPSHRYLVECAVQGSQPGTTFTASDGDASYSVGGDERTTLLYRVENAGAAARQVRVVISGDRPGWFLAGCEISAAAIG